MAKNPPRVPFAQPNLVDKVIGYFDPKRMQTRLLSRTSTALMGGYTGARTDRASLATWSRAGLGGSPTTDIVPDLPQLRERSRDQMRNAAVATGALNTTCSHVVGTGLSFSPGIDAAFLGLSDEEGQAWQDNVKRRFNTWAGSPDCDVARHLDFYGLQELGFRTWMESGDAFVLTPILQRPGRAAQLALQLLEADRVCNQDRAPDTRTRIDGIEIDPDTGEALSVWIASSHPGDLRFKALTWENRDIRGASSGRRNVLHLMKPLRPGQVRGVPWIAPILEPLKQLGRWTDNELNAAVTSSLFAMFVKMDADAFDDLFADDSKKNIVDSASKWSGNIESGKAVNLLPGEDVTTAVSGRPNPEFDPFWAAMVRQIGMALEIPYEVLVMHFQSSYSAARGALLMAWKFFRARRDLLAKMLCQPVYELWLANEIAQGRIGAAGFFADDVVRAAWCAGVWTGDGPGSIDPLKEVDAAAKRVELEISTLQAESILHDGVDWDVKHEQRVKEITAQKADGTYAPPGAAPAQPASYPSDPPPPAPDR